MCRGAAPGIGQELLVFIFFSGPTGAQKLSMTKFRISSAATEDLKYILERQIHVRRWFGVVLSALVPSGVQACTPQHCKSTRMGSESAKAEHDQISNFVGCYRGFKIHSGTTNQC